MEPASPRDVLGRLLGPEIAPHETAAVGVVPEEVRLRRSAWLTRVAAALLGNGRRVAAVTLGRTIVMAPGVEPTARLLRHELAHVRQWEASPLFPLRYVLAHARHGYLDNPYEVEARAAESVEAGAAESEGARGRPRRRTYGLERAMTSVVTIERHIIEQERLHPDATGAFSSILYDMALAAKIIAREVRQAGLIDILGGTDSTNVHGEKVRKLDVYAHDVIYRAFDHTGLLCCMASEEAEEVIAIPDKFTSGGYVLIYDPLDGSSNIDANISIGSIFSIHRKVSAGDRGGLRDCLQPGTDQVGAGYVLYGSSTMLVYTTGAGVHGFTLDPSIGEFLLSHPDIRIPDPGQRIYSVNEGNYRRWSERQRALVDRLKGVDGSGGRPFSHRYVGSMVADFHRTLLYGGLFMYPADEKSPSGKLRLQYEANPLAFVCEQAGGAGSDGRRRLLEVPPHELHQRTPVYLGNAEHVALAEEMLAGG